jgi:septum formation protein
MADKSNFPQLVLASQSPVRTRLLRNAGLSFLISPAQIDEKEIISSRMGDAPEKIAERLALEKARAVGSLSKNYIVAADQLLVFKGEILQKPADMAAARQRLLCLAGSDHFLVTGAVLTCKGQTLWRHAETARLSMHALSKAEIERHMALQGQEILQSVGAYRLEGPDISLFAALEGDYFSMLGLPLVPLLSAIRHHAPQFLPGAEPV